MLKWKGNTPDISDKCIILVIGTINVSGQTFGRNVGIGSSSYNLLKDDKISLETSINVAGLNTVQGWYTTGKSILELGKKYEFGWSYPWNVWKKNWKLN